MSDYHLIYLYLNAENINGFNFLYQRYHQIINIITKKIFHKFFTIPLEITDLETITYFIFCQAIFNFYQDRQKTFHNYLITNLKWGILKYLKQYLAKKHQIINLSLVYQEYMTNSSVSYQEVIFKYQDFNLKLSFLEKNVLQLRQQGFDNNEIMTKLNLTYKQVDNAWQRIMIKVKKYNS